jgi:hypothetical protein
MNTILRLVNGRSVIDPDDQSPLHQVGSRVTAEWEETRSRDWIERLE